MAFLAVLLLAVGLSSQALDTEDLIRQGIDQHDAGQYAAAIQNFDAALEIEPRHPVARYELTNSLFSLGDFDSCVDSAKAGLRLRSAFEAGFHMMAGSCHSSAGRSRKALRAFREGLEIAPENARLHFNLAITLFGIGEPETAVGHLQTAISHEPTYSSPYLYLGEYHRQVGERVQGIFYLARFFTLENDTGRSRQAATNTLGLLSSGIEAKSPREISVTLPEMVEGDPFSTLEVALSLAGVTQLDRNANANESASDAERGTEALTTFLQMALEMSESESNGPAIRATKVWDQAMELILSLHRGKNSEALGYLMTRAAGIDGAEIWIRSNLEKVEELGQLLATKPH